MHSLLFTLSGLIAAVAAQQSKPISICVAGQCLEGQVNATNIGATVEASNATFLLLPGQYTASNAPSDLAQALSSATTTVSLTAGFSNSSQNVSPSIPFSVELQPGVLSYPSDLYNGNPTFIPLPDRPNSLSNGTALSRGSLILAPNTWAAISATNGGSTTRTVVWDTFPFISQLPPALAGTLSIVDMQSSSCSPTCAGVATCSNGRCVCPEGFTGASCETCEANHFGPDCTPCDSSCEQCEDGPTGSGICLDQQVPTNAPSNCNCENGTCNSTGGCTCSVGWANPTTSGAACSVCARGFFLNASGNCEACHRGCKECSDGTGVCTECAPGAVRDGSNSSKCIASDVCGRGFFRDTRLNDCVSCDSSCRTCGGGGPADCIECADGTLPNAAGLCVSPNAQGICTGTNLWFNFLQESCDTCPLKCATCQIPNFSARSPTDPEDVQCSTCLPGFFLVNGRCEDKCPDGQVVGSDGVTCQACSSSCGTCQGSPDFCLTCKNGQFANGGTCVRSCPANTFQSGNSCLPCHSDCATCSGAGFDKCLSCPTTLPILSSGRCVPTCSRTEYFDNTSSSCKSCDSSCGSCSGPGASGCLSCAKATQVLRAGTCLDVNCGDGLSGSDDGGVVPGLGVCLVELVKLPEEELPPVVIPPVDNNAQDNLADKASNNKNPLEWWHYLLIGLGGLALIVLGFILWRRYARQKRQSKTNVFRGRLEGAGFWKRFWTSPFSAIGGLFKKREQLHHHSRKNTDNKDLEDGTSSSYYTTTRSRSWRDTYDARTERRRSWVTMEERPERRPSIDGRSIVTDAKSGYGYNPSRSAPRTYESRRDDRSVYSKPYSQRNERRDRDYSRRDDNRESQYARSIDQRSEYTEYLGPSRSRLAPGTSTSRRRSYTSHHHSEYAAKIIKPQYHINEYMDARSQRPPSPSSYYNSNIGHSGPQPKEPVKDLLTSRLSDFVNNYYSNNNASTSQFSQGSSYEDQPKPTEADSYKWSVLVPNTNAPAIVPINTGGSGRDDRNPFRKPTY